MSSVEQPQPQQQEQTQNEEVSDEVNDKPSTPKPEERSEDSSEPFGPEDMDEEEEDEDEDNEEEEAEDEEEEEEEEDDDDDEDEEDVQDEEKPEQDEANDKNKSRTSRELKSLLALSKEAKLDTNLSHRRKTIDSTYRLRDESPKVKENSQTTKFPVTADTENERPINEKTHPMKNKRKSEVGVEGATESATNGRNIKNVVYGELKMLKPNKDMFCWRCHRDGVGIACETCPRSYHQKCLKNIVADTENWPCPECVAILKAENTKTRSKAMREMTLDHLCTLLKFAVKRMIQCVDSEPFVNDVNEDEFPDYPKYIVQPMNLTLLEKNIKSRLYGSPQAFEADAKWILHNSIVFNSHQSKLTTTAKFIVKVCKQEMAEIENCPSCYLNANTKKNTWFVEVCPKPHLLVWAKLKGFPYWPAKVMSVNNLGMVDVRFFGAHDRAWVHYKDCYLYSVKDPNSNKQKRNDIIQCIKELEMYVENLKKVHGKVNFAPFKTLLEPDNELKQLRQFLPTYKEGSKKDDGNDKNQTTVSDEHAYSTNSKVENSESSVDDDYDPSDDVDENDDGENEDPDEDETDNEKDEGEQPVKKKRIRRKRHLNEDENLSAKRAMRATSRKNSPAPEKNISNSSSDNEFLADLKTKPIQVNVDENKELTISPQKTKISDELIKKLSDSTTNLETGKECDTNVTSTSDDKENEMEIDNKDDPKDEGEEKKEKFMKSDKPEEIKIDPIHIRNIIHSSLNDITISTKSKSDSNKTTEEQSPSIDLKYIKCKTYKRKTSMKNVEDEPAIQKLKLSDEVSLEKRNDSTTNNNSNTKRRSIEETEKDNTESIYPPSVLKLVPIENILNKNIDADKPKDNENSSQNLVVLKEVRLVKDNGKEIKPKKKIPKPMEETPLDSTIQIKSEPESESESGEVNYLEAKRQYLSALNISEKQTAAVENKTNEIRTRSRAEKKKNQALNASKTNTDDAENTTTNKESKEIYVKPLSKMQELKQKARKSFPMPNYSKGKTLTKSTTLTEPSKTVKLLPKVISNIQPMTTMTLEPRVSSSLIIVPKLIPQAYTTPVLTVVSPPQLTKNVPSLAPMSTITVSSIKKPHESEVLSMSTNNETNSVSNVSSSTTNDANAANRANNILNGTTKTVTLNDNSENQLNELNVLKDALPETLSKGISDIICRPLPKLKPKPPGLLTTIYDEGVPSSAGPLAAKINSVAHRMSDYFRGLLTETLNDFGKADNPEATISNLKLQIETLKHNHSLEIMEIKKNVATMLKDIQKTIIEEKERLVIETKTKCEQEAIKRVEEAKSKQWCANCFKEAQFYCCWNTSYCDYPCQQKHWLKHMNKCTQNASQNQTVSIASSVIRSAGQPVIFKQANIAKYGGSNSKQRFVLKKTTNTPIASSSAASSSSGHHLTLLKTPGNFELFSNGSVSINGKILPNTSLKVKSGNVISVTSTTPSSNANNNNNNANKQIVASTPVSSVECVVSVDPGTILNPTTSSD